MIWGAGGKIEKGFIFSAGMPFENYFSWRRPLEIYFFLEKAFWDYFFPGRSFEIYFFLGLASNFFSLYKPIRKLPNLVFLSQKFYFLDYFFREEGLLRFIFSWRRPFEIYFFFWKRASECFFSSHFLWASPQIINGRPLSKVLCDFL